MVSLTARMTSPLRKQWSRHIRPARPRSGKKRPTTLVGHKFQGSDEADTSDLTYQWVLAEFLPTLLKVGSDFGANTFDNAFLLQDTEIGERDCASHRVP